MRRHVGKVIAIAVVVIAIIAVTCSRGGGSSIADDYYVTFRSECPLEQRYSQLGPHEVLQLDLPNEDERIGAVRVWYPAELETSDVSWPVVVVVNASASPASTYEPWFARLASWGFVVVGNEDPQAGTGETASLTLDVVVDLPDGCSLAGKLDEDHMGIVGFSQGGRRGACGPHAVRERRPVPHRLHRQRGVPVPRGEHGVALRRVEGLRALAHGGRNGRLG